MPTAASSWFDDEMKLISRIERWSQKWIQSKRDLQRDFQLLAEPLLLHDFPLLPNHYLWFNEAETHKHWIPLNPISSTRMEINMNGSIIIFFGSSVIASKSDGSINHVEMKNKAQRNLFTENRLWILKNCQKYSREEETIDFSRWSVSSRCHLGPETKRKIEDGGEWKRFFSCEKKNWRNKQNRNDEISFLSSFVCIASMSSWCLRNCFWVCAWITCKCVQNHY